MNNHGQGTWIRLPQIPLLPCGNQENNKSKCFPKAVPGKRHQPGELQQSGGNLRSRPQMLAGNILSFGVDGCSEPVHIYLTFPGMLDLTLVGNRWLFTD